MESPICFRCRRKPAEIDEYQELVREYGFDNEDQAVREEEGTYNPENDLFACTDCYIAVGMPSSPTGWKPAGLIRGEKG